MAARADSFDLGRLHLSSGEATSAELIVAVEALEFGGQTYTAEDGLVDVRLDVSRTTGQGHSLRLRFDARLSGPCMRCLEDAGALVEVDAREVDQPAAGDDDLSSPYLDDQELDLRAWARDSLVLSLPVQIVCKEDCRGLCPVCGADLNAEPGHEHEKEPDPRWAKLSELELD